MSFKTAARTTLLLLLLLLLLPAAGSAARAPFAPRDEPLHYAPARSYDLQHLRLDLAFDWDRREVSGTATNTLTPLLPGLRTLVFHDAGLEIRQVRLNGTALPAAAVTADPSAETLAVDLGHAYGPQDRLEVAIDYSARPGAGLYFVGGEKGYPDKPRQIWSQGEPELNRHWFPSWDYPNDRTTTELFATVAKPFLVVGNGRLVEVLDRPDGRRTYHWSMEQPHSTYLVSVVVGELTRVADEWKGIPVEYYVPPAYASEARRSFGHTPDMIDYYSTVTGRPYPYAKYAQTTAVDFTWGGMENISATTQTLRTLHDERADTDSPSDPLVAHELAHQWFGDLITCEDWAHAWLNEGMADYFTALYLGHADGAAELAWQLDDYRQDFLKEEREEYRRPIVTYRYPAPVAMFDDTTYKKGALVLHMIHGLLGDDGWWKGIRAYVDRFALQTVKTSDLQSVLEEVTGVTLGPVFDQFVYGAGHPELKLRWDYQADRGLVHLSVRQDQELDDETGLFSFPVEIGLVGEKGEKGMEIQKVPVLARREQDLYLPSPSRPRTVVFDPRGWVLATADFDKPTAEWIAQLDSSGETAAQLEALRALGKIGDAAAVEALQKALREHPFHGIREVAARALAEAGTESALAALRAGLGDEDSRVRTAALDGLGEFSEHRELLPDLRRALEGDSSYKARAAAAKSLGKFRNASSEVAPWLVRALSQESHGEAVRAAALRSLAELDAPGAVDQAFRYAAYGAPAESRDDAMRALARIAAHRKDPELRARVRRTLEGFLGESDVRVRERAQAALGQLGDPEAVPALERSARAEPDLEQQRSARKAIDEIQGKGAEDQSLRLRVQQLEREVDVLKSQLDDSKGGAKGGAAEKSPGSR